MAAELAAAAVVLPAVLVGIPAASADSPTRTTWRTPAGKPGRHLRVAPFAIASLRLGIAWLESSVPIAS